jgi:uncharacterized protein YndB with AHSA1/START domain
LQAIANDGLCAARRTMGVTMRFLMPLTTAALALGATPAHAEVHDSNAAGFAVRATAEVPASPDAVWDMLLDPAEWWAGNHTFSGDAANLSLDPRAGGCFCELLPNAAAKQDTPRGGVQHMQVVYIEKPKTLRLSGALGPLQSEPVVGTLTFMIRADGKATRINAEYAVGGYMRIPSERMAPLVDKVITEQVGRLAAKLGGAVKASPATVPTREAAPPALPSNPRPIIGR